MSRAVDYETTCPAGDEALAHGVGNTTARTDDRGTRIVKDRPLAVVAVVAHDLACI